MFQSCPPSWHWKRNACRIEGNCLFQDQSSSLCCLSNFKSVFSQLHGPEQVTSGNVKHSRQLCNSKQWRQRHTLHLLMTASISLGKMLLQQLPLAMCKVPLPFVVIMSSRILLACSKSLTAAPKMNNLVKSCSSWCPVESLSTDTFVSCLFYSLCMRSQKPLFQIRSLLQLLGDCHDLIYNVAELHWFISSGKKVLLALSRV